jgi:hypothetical protein
LHAIKTAVKQPFVFMLLLSYGEVIPMRATQRYTGDELVDACQKRMARFAALTGSKCLPSHVFVRRDDQLEYVPDDRLASTCDAVARYHDQCCAAELEY